MLRSTKRKFALVSLLLSLLLAIMGASGAFAAPQTEKTTEEKFQELIEKGIFDGFKKNSLDGNMTRAQTAIIIAKLLELEEDPPAAVYHDLEGADWAVGYIGAITKAGIMQGHGNGIFDPGGEVTQEQMAVIAVKILGLKAKPGAEVPGVSDWARGYVAAALQAGLIPASNDYTMPAKTGALVETSYAASACMNEPALAVTDAKLDLGGDSGVLTIGFTTAIAAESVQLDAIVVNGAPLNLGKDQVAVSEDGKTLTITLKEAYDRPAGQEEPAIDVGGIQTACSKPMPEASRSVALEVVNEPPAKPKPAIEPEPSSEPDSSNPPSGDPSPWIDATVTSSTYSSFYTVEITVDFKNVDSIAYMVAQPEDINAPTPEQIQIGVYSYFKYGDCINVSSPAPYKITIGAVDEGWNTQPFHVYVVGIKGLQSFQYTDVQHFIVP